MLCDTGMEGYFIGSGAMVLMGNQARLTSVSLHAKADAPVRGMRACIFDFEGSSLATASRLLFVAAGWSRGQAQHGLIEPLLAREVCSLADVIAGISAAAGSPEVHIFARWLIGDLTLTQLARSGISVVAHAVDEVEQAALVCGERYERLAFRRAA